MDIKDIEKQRIQWSGMTDPGRFRKNNEDAFLALQFNAKEVLRLGKYGQANLEQADYIFAVSDGMGGANAGEYASQIAVNKMIKLFPQTFRASATGFHLGFQDIWQSSLIKFIVNCGISVFVTPTCGAWVLP